MKYYDKKITWKQGTWAENLERDMENSVFVNCSPRSLLEGEVSLDKESLDKENSFNSDVNFQEFLLKHSIDDRTTEDCYIFMKRERGKFY